MALEYLLPFAAIPLRLMLGILYIVHGYPKIKNNSSIASFFQSLGIPLPRISAVIVAVVEFFGGIALILGFGTRVVAALLAVNMIVAAYMRKTKMKNNFVGGYEFDITLVAVFIALVLLGAGNYSIDNAMGWLLG